MSMRLPGNFRNAQRSAAQQNMGRAVLTGRPYYSHVRFSAARSGNSPAFTFTLLAGVLAKAFAFKIGDDMGVAGRGGTIATLADTNIYAPSETIDSEKVHIDGIMLQLASAGGQSDPAFAVNALRDISARVAFNGSQHVWDLGNCEMIPGGSAFYAGSAVASASSGGTVGSASLGLPDYGNYFPIVGGIDWNPKGQQDSSLIVTFFSERQVAYNVSNAGAPATTTFDLRVQLVSLQTAKASDNA